LSLGLPIPQKDDRHLATLLPLSIDPMWKIEKMKLDKLMEEAERKIYA
jgi:hypothetical protein